MPKSHRDWGVKTKSSIFKCDKALAAMSSTTS